MSTRRRLALVAAGIGAALVVAMLASGVAWQAVDRPPPEARMVPPEPLARATEAEAASRLIAGAFGADWTPAPNDAALLESSSLQVEGEITPTDTLGFGLEVRVDGEASITLPGTFRSVRFEAEIEMVDFNGSWDLVHHRLAPVETVDLSYDAADLLFLQAVSGDRVGRMVGEKVVRRFGEPMVLALTTHESRAIGRLDGRKVVDMVLDSGDLRDAGGPCELRLHGQGTLRLRRLRISSLAD